jgi:hypothetical protein
LNETEADSQPSQLAQNKEVQKSMPYCLMVQNFGCSKDPIHVQVKQLHDVQAHGG